MRVAANLRDLTGPARIYLSKSELGAAGERDASLPNEDAHRNVEAFQSTSGIIDALKGHNSCIARLSWP